MSEEKQSDGAQRTEPAPNSAGNNGRTGLANESVEADREPPPPPPRQ